LAKVAIEEMAFISVEFIIGVFPSTIGTELFPVDIVFGFEDT